MYKDDRCVVPEDIVRIILEFSGMVRFGKRGIVYIINFPRLIQRR